MKARRRGNSCQEKSHARERGRSRGRVPSQIIEDALAGYLEQAASLRTTLDSRHDGPRGSPEVVGCARCATGDFLGSVPNE
jgi:hypothetical protein